jgi:hypothetical protein
LQKWVLRRFFHLKVFQGEYWVYPLGGQARRIAKIVNLVDSFKPSLIIETGTYLGTTTPMLATISDARCVTIEKIARYAKKARQHFDFNYPDLNIESVVGNSSDELGKLLSGLPLGNERVLAYLDAHWFDYLPTNDELKALINWGGAFVAIIDDFCVEEDEGYGWDEYINGNKVDKHLVPKNLMLFVPATSSKLEGLYRKGTAYVVNEKARKEIDSAWFKDLRRIYS